ncbi:hypothetical protein OC842_005102 [Tilletia horrida]|uniref:Letm1 RBD domain-containing protein n=1 Tax=Tilletia horrida TaxID=155126 RepID=A0AAN6G8F8_9BASI|nr:hypothetical protein OC842_005102 [Tilletia horrida]
MLRPSAARPLQRAVQLRLAARQAQVLGGTTATAAASTSLSASLSRCSPAAPLELHRVTRVGAAALHTSALRPAQDPPSSGRNSGSRSGSIQASSSSTAASTQRSSEPSIPPPGAPPPKILRSLAPAPSTTSKTGVPLRAAPSSSFAAAKGPAAAPAPAAAASSSSSPPAAKAPVPAAAPSAAPPTATSTATPTPASGSSPTTSSTPTQASADASPAIPAEASDKPAESVTLWQRAVRAYETLKFLFLFYLNGVKQIFRNRTRVLEIQARVKEGGRALSREESQLIKTHDSDMRKLPLFLAIVLILEELLPLVVIYAPGLLPSTCILPSQMAKIRAKEEDRRTAAVKRLRGEAEGRARLELAAGVGAVQAAAAAEAEAEAANGWEEDAKRVVGQLDAASLKDLALTFKLPTWGGSYLQRGRLASHLAYLRADDALMAGSGVNDEVPQDLDGLSRACTERGLRASGADPVTMSESLRSWLSHTRPRHAGALPSASDVLTLPLKLYDVPSATLSDSHAPKPVATSGTSPTTTTTTTTTYSASGSVLDEAKAVAREVVEAEREVVEREKRVAEEVRRKEESETELPPAARR